MGENQLESSHSNQCLWTQAVRSETAEVMSISTFDSSSPLRSMQRAKFYQNQMNSTFCVNLCWLFCATTWKRLELVDSDLECSLSSQSTSVSKVSSKLDLHYFVSADVDFMFCAAPWKLLHVSVLTLPPHHWLDDNSYGFGRFE